MSTRRPSVFIGSSREGLGVAQAIQVNLDHACESAVWSQGVFGLSGGTLETLVNRAREFDFAILVVTPDDMGDIRDEIQPIARDNVLIEVGLFIGTLGRDRTFIVYDRAANIRIPSDLAGITLADFERHSSGNLAASLGAACTRIQDAIARLGLFVPQIDNTAMLRNADFQNISNLLDVQSIQLIILMQEQNIRIPNETTLHDFGVFYEYMSANGSSGLGSLEMRPLCSRLADAEILQQDLRNMVSLTDRGREFARWMTEHGRKVTFFETSVGGWGEPLEGHRGHVARMSDHVQRLRANAIAAVRTGFIVNPPSSSGADSACQ
jgi:Predicted nucleotide-binding protein containing TIR-like domain